MNPLRSSTVKLAPFAFVRTALVTAGTGLALFISGCASSGPDRPVAAVDEDETLKLQIFLDARNFGPGVVDNRQGEFTRKALAIYRKAHGIAPSKPLPLEGIQPYTRYTITAEDVGLIGTMASEPAEIAKQRRLPYTSVGELLSERFHTSETFLRKLNPSVDLGRTPAGTVVRVPNVRRPFMATEFPSRYPAPAPAVAKSRRVLVDTHERILRVIEGERVIAAFPITPGSSEHPAPAGQWRIVGAVPWPWYRYDEGVLKRGERTKDFYLFPPGANSPVGIVWAGLNRAGVGIHGTSSPGTIGRTGSHGCIRLSNWDVATFYTLVGKGTPVTIQ